MTRAIALLVLASCSANDDFPGPHVAGIAPTQASPGTTATVTGNYFCHQPPTDDPLLCENVGVVQFGSTTATAAQYTDTAITVEVPNGAGSVDVSVTVAGHLSNSVHFTIE